jgi:hypothetical protein
LLICGVVGAAVNFLAARNRFDPHWIVTDVLGPTAVARLAIPHAAGH